MGSAEMLAELLWFSSLFERKSGKVRFGLGATNSCYISGKTGLQPLNQRVTDTNFIRQPTISAYSRPRWLLIYTKNLYRAVFRPQEKSGNI